MFVSAAGATHRRVRSVRRLRRVPAVAAAVAVVGLVSTGCAAGQIAQTADQKSTIDGINATVGTMDLRIVALQAPPGLRTTYPKGSSAPFNVVFVNNDAGTADRLVDVRTSAATGWAAYSRQADAFTVVEGTLSTPTSSASAEPTTNASASDSPSGSDSASESPSGSPSDTTSESASSSESASNSESASSSESASASTSAPRPRGVQSVTIPAGGRTGFGTPEATGGLILQGLTRALRPAETINVTFTFANAGSVTVPVTVQVADLGRTNEVGKPEGE